MKGKHKYVEVIEVKVTLEEKKINATPNCAVTIYFCHIDEPTPPFLALLTYRQSSVPLSEGNSKGSRRREGCLFWVGVQCLLATSILLHFHSFYGSSILLMLWRKPQYTRGISVGSISISEKFLYVSYFFHQSSL